MSGVTITTWTCRRCGSQEAVSGIDPPANWVKASFRVLRGGPLKLIGDLCNPCGGYLVSFVHGTDQEDIARDAATDAVLAQINAEVADNMADLLWRTGTW